ncbi:ABC transporter permease [Thioalbus denitrificans]|uniref:Putative ABC transport system permease protein n=1 Tax=Thioalbus denitrificans TaxID=547122 RepID=A0A369CJN2_9GAMM|nr:ABC transporter permease [Thioalbus denitrificans]RCX32054.1 putative ABC transport system permease protein [Thioalbus denitrificans]
MFWNALLLSLREIRRNLLRSFLTILGIVIGVAAVITMVTLGNGATAMVSNQIASLGSNLIMVRPGRRMGPGRDSAGSNRFKLADAQAIFAEVNSIKAVAPSASQTVTAIYATENWSTSVTGSTNDYFAVGNWELQEGREFTPSELRAGKAACVIGATVRKELFGTRSPVGSKIRLKQFSCEIIGLLRSKGQSAMGMDQDDVIVIPLRTFQRRISGKTEVSSILVSVRDGASTEKVQADITRLLRERRHIAANEDDDFNVLDTKQIAETLTGTTRVLTMLLGAVAAVSLLVGGIGIMNIMLVSVTERTREIGIRLAIGALEREVLLQFLVEAVVLSSLGGVVGVVLAVSASMVLADLMQVPFILDPAITLLAFLFSAAVGVVFGYFPARRAARLDPIEALRHE